MRTLVTGATGLVGNNVVRLLLERGESVRVLRRSTSNPRSLAGLAVEHAFGDVRDPVAVRRAMAGMERVVHAAAVVHIGWTGLELQQSINVEGTRHVAQAALRHGVRMVHVSSVDALGIGSRELPANEDTPPSGHCDCPYVLTKRGAERVIEQHVAEGLDAVLVNPCYMLGPWDWKPSSGRMLLEIARGLGVFAPPGGNDFCDVRDVAAGIVLAAERGRAGRRYILTGEALSYLQAWTLFADVTGARRPLGIAWNWAQRFAGRAGDLWTRISGHEPDVNTAAVRMATLEHHFDGARSEAELGYKPRPLRETVEDAWDWFCRNGYAPRRSAVRLSRAETVAAEFERESAAV